jgi:hypothetical protein
MKSWVVPLIIELDLRPKVGLAMGESTKETSLGMLGWWVNISGDLEAKYHNAKGEIGSSESQEKPGLESIYCTLGEELYAQRGFESESGR